MHSSLSKHHTKAFSLMEAKWKLLLQERFTNSTINRIFLGVILGISKTLPRKLSFSSSGTFSTGAAKALQLGPAVAMKSRTSSSGQLLSHAVSSDPLLTSIPAPGTAANPIALQGHMLQRIHFRVPAICELCKRACWHVILPPPALQCLHCQVS